jgi:hypothetical protein
MKYILQTRTNLIVSIALFVVSILSISNAFEINTSEKILSNVKNEKIKLFEKISTEKELEKRIYFQIKDKTNTNNFFNVITIIIKELNNNRKF